MPDREHFPCLTILVTEEPIPACRCSWPSSRGAQAGSDTAARGALGLAMLPRRPGSPRQLLGARRRQGYGSRADRLADLALVGPRRERTESANGDCGAIQPAGHGTDTGSELRSMLDGVLRRHARHVLPEGIPSTGDNLLGERRSRSGDHQAQRERRHGNKASAHHDSLLQSEVGCGPPWCAAPVPCLASVLASSLHRAERPAFQGAKVPTRPRLSTDPPTGSAGSGPAVARPPLHTLAERLGPAWSRVTAVVPRLRASHATANLAPTPRPCVGTIGPGHRGPSGPAALAPTRGWCA